MLKGKNLVSILQNIRFKRLITINGVFFGIDQNYFLFDSNTK